MSNLKICGINTVVLSPRHSPNRWNQSGSYGLPKTAVFFVFLLFVHLLFAHSQSRAASLDDLSKEQLLDCLDDVIAHKMDYRHRLLSHIDSLKRRADSQDLSQRAETYMQIFQAYTSVQSDSAMTYLARTEALPLFGEDAELAARVKIGRAKVLGVMGLYSSALPILQSVDARCHSDRVRLFYYQVCRTLYGWMSDYGEIYDQKVHYRDLTQMYRDSIISIQQPGIDRNIVKADRALTLGDIGQAKAICLKNIPHADELQRAYLYVIMSDIAHEEQNTDEEIRYLAITAINDLQRGITEYRALPKLAILLSKTSAGGDRAYNYLICTMEDAVYCKARLRTIEASSIFPIIEQGHRGRMHDRLTLTLAIACAVLLSLVILAIALFYAHRRNRQLAEIHKQLDAAIAAQRKVNEALTEANAQLVHANQVKATYIARYLERCRSYIDSMDVSRKRLLKMLRNGQQAEAVSLLKSDKSLSEEEQIFYTDFDEAFLTLYPDFVAHFNALLQPEAQVVVKRDELLNTELRIFALIRLGITDSNRIAHFLNYSLPTIYSYRSRLRNKSIFPKEEFESRVMQC